MFKIKHIDTCNDEIWVEKYRPDDLNHIVGNKEIVNRLKEYVKSQNFPNLLFSGRPGIGKTTCAIALCKELLKDLYSFETVLELNASDERGIAVVRDLVKEFSKRINTKIPFSIIILDECDNMTNDAQNALRRIIEKSHKQCRFILICNYSSKIIEPIQSRCSVFTFAPVEKEEMIKGLQDIMKKEDIKMNDEAMNAILYVAKGDMRKAINILEGMCKFYKQEITADFIFSICGYIDPYQIKMILKEAIEGNYSIALEMLRKLLYEKGFSGYDMIEQFHRELMAFNIDDRLKIHISSKIGEIQYRLICGASEEIQMDAMIGAISATAYE